MNSSAHSIESPFPGVDLVTFPDVLRTACRDVVERLEAAGGMLLLYDDLADAFSVVVTEGEGYLPLAGVTFSLESESGIGRALEDNALTVSSAVNGFGHAAESFRQACGGNEVLLIPLWSSIPIGVVAVELPGRELTPEMRAAAARAGAEAGRRIDEARPESGHYCLFRRIVHRAPGGFAVVEGDEHVVSYATASFRHMLGLDSIPFLGRPMRDVVTDGRAGVGLLDDVRATGQTRQLAAEEVTDQFGSRYYDVHLIPERWGASAAAVFVVLWPRTDVVHARHALEGAVAQLAESQDTLAAVLDSTINGVLFSDCHDVVLYSNRRLGELMGIDPRSLLGQPRRRLMADTLLSHGSGSGTMLDMHEGETDRRVIREMEVQNPSRRTLEHYSGPVHRQDGELLGRIDVFSDVTEVRDLQRNKDQFLSVVSHELKTPVTSIKGYAQLLRRWAEREQADSRTLAAYGIIERQTARMQDLIDMLLDLSRIEVGRLALDLAPIELCSLVAETVEASRISADGHDIRLDLHEDPIWIEGDARRLEQVFTNLLSNAARYSPEGSEIDVTLESWEGGAAIAVRDRGFGIPADARDRVFERFFRVRGREETAGMGIGLYIAKSIVEEHGGSIGVESELGVGSTFTVRLPSEPV